MLRVIVTGAAGRMGREVVQAVTAEDDMTVAAAVDPGAPGIEIDDGAGSTVPVTADLPEALDRAGADVLVDFTQADAAVANVRAALAAGVSCVVGTTGVASDVFESLARTAPEGVSLFVAPNFAIGAVLMMRFAAETAAYMPHVEITELHHERKVDAPSGTAMRTAALVARSRGSAPSVPGRETEVAEGARGAVVDGVHVHSVRLPGLVAHQEVVFGGTGQTLTIRHDSVDRTSFMPGVVLAVRRSPALAGLVVGLDALLDGPDREGGDAT